MKNTGKGILEQIADSASVTTFVPLTGDALKELMIDLSAIPSSTSPSVEEYLETIRKTGVVWKEASKVGPLTHVDEWGNPVEGSWITKNPIEYGTGGPVPDPDGSIKAVFDNAKLEAQRARLRELRLLVDFNWLVEEADLDDPDFLVDDVPEEERELLIGMIKEERGMLASPIRIHEEMEKDKKDEDFRAKFYVAWEEVMKSEKVAGAHEFVLYGGKKLLEEIDEFYAKAEEKLWHGDKLMDLKKSNSRKEQARTEERARQKARGKGRFGKLFKGFI